MLIVIEGLDGAGKSTQVRKMKEYLSAKTGSLKYIHFPRYDAPVYGKLISSYLKGDFGSIAQVHPNLVALLFAEDRHGAAPELSSALQEGKTVLLDRYVYSNIAYQCAKLSCEQERSALRDWIFDTEYNCLGIPKPDLNIFLDVPLSFVEKKLSGDRGGADRAYLEGSHDIHEADINFQRDVRSLYLSQCSLDSSFIRVDCSDEWGNMLAPDVIFGKLRKLVDEKL